MALAVGCGAMVLPISTLYGKSHRLLPVTKVTLRVKIAIADRIS
jgi:hypothetical protein